PRRCTLADAGSLDDAGQPVVSGARALRLRPLGASIAAIAAPTTFFWSQTTMSRRSRKFALASAVGMALPFAALALALPASALAQATDAARALAADALIVDTHVDAPGVLVSSWADLGEAAPDREFDYPRAREGGLDVAFMSIYTSARQDESGSAWQAANAQIDAMEALVARHPDRFAILTSPGDVERLREGGRVLLPLGMENGGPIGEDLAQLAFFHERGVRYITLAHSGNNRIADSSYTVEKRWNGLSPFGREVIA